MKRRKNTKQDVRPIRNCTFCKKGTLPSYKEPEGLSRYLSDRGRILNKGFTGVCSKHQRMLTQEIKRARHLGLLPFTSRI